VNGESEELHQAGMAEDANGLMIFSDLVCHCFPIFSPSMLMGLTSLVASLNPRNLPSSKRFQVAWDPLALRAPTPGANSKDPDPATE
jgi:hypothetical protein